MAHRSASATKPERAVSFPIKCHTSHYPSFSAARFRGACFAYQSRPTSYSERSSSVNCGPKYLIAGAARKLSRSRGAQESNALGNKAVALSAILGGRITPRRLMGTKKNEIELVTLSTRGRQLTR